MHTGPLQEPIPAETSSWREELVPFLERPESYPQVPERVRLLQTHISYVAIASPYVYKIKKPVTLDFLDFSTLKKRAHFCQREIELNRRLCPDVYLGVVPIVLRDGRLQFGNDDVDGSVVDFAVKMRELDEGLFLSRMLQNGQAVPGTVDRIVNKLVPFYQQQDPGPEITENGRVEQVRRTTSGNLAQARELVGDVVSGSAFEAIEIFQRRFHEKQHALLARRPEEGRIMDCHGDLRPEHIHLGPDCVCVYDCIEFNDRFRYIDAAAEIAFLAMELDHADRPDLARYLVAQMARRLDDPDMDRLMNFYKCYRAVVRAKVQGIRKDEEDVPAAQREKSRRRSGRYFQRALNYAVAGSRAVVMAVMGRIATGKTSLAHALGKELGWPVFSSDRVRKELAGLPASRRPRALVRQRLYSEAMSRRTYDRLVELGRIHAQKGESVILDATFSTRQRRRELRSNLEKVQCDVLFVEVQAPDDVIRERLRQRAAEEEATSDARLEDFRKLTKRYEAPEEMDDATFITLDGTAPPQQEMRAVYAHLVERSVDA
jgi:aminoglycoside phosphotransferase family enzyme/predicted kinase